MKAFRLGLAGSLLAVCLVGCAKAPPKEETGAPNLALAQYVLDEVPSDVKNRTFIDFEGKVQIVGYDVDPPGPVGPGQKVKLTLYWKCSSELGPDWSLFTHITVAGGARVPGNFDDVGPLRTRASQSSDQALSPSAWQPGKVYVDVQELEIPRDIAVSEVSILTGVWRGNERLDVISGPSDGQRRAIVTRVKTGVVPAGPAEPGSAAKKS